MKKINYVNVVFTVFLLVLSLTVVVLGADVESLPTATEWITLEDYQAPGDNYEIDLTLLDSDIDSQTPQIAEWNETVHPGESFVMSGVNFALVEGSKPTVWVWANTTDGGNLYQASVFKATNNIIASTLPEDIPFGMYLIWVENNQGISKPITLNKTIAEWIGPLGNKVRPGETKRVIGRNLAYKHGNDVSNIYIKDETGKLIECNIIKVEPYSVEFKVPENIQDGTYQVYAHNGHGGKYGWSQPLELIIDSWQRGDTEIVISPSDNDNTNIQEAINKLAQKETGGTVRLTEGEFELGNRGLFLRSGVRLTGVGKDKTFLRGGDVTLLANTAFENMTFTRSLSGFKLEDARIANVRFVDASGNAITSIRIGNRGEITNSEVGHIYAEGDSWIHNNIIIGSYGNSGHGGSAGVHINDYNIVENNKFENDWPVGSDGKKVLSTNEWRTASRDWLKLFEYPWLNRIMMVFGNHNYIAHNDTKYVAQPEGNAGEMILFHGLDGYWFGQVKENDGKTMQVITDGLINGESQTLSRGRKTSSPFNSANIEIGNYVMITQGTGMGQSRKIVDLDQEKGTVTVDSPWRVEPASDSVINISFQFNHNIIYRNHFVSFPEGYKLTVFSANRPVSLWGNSWKNVLEGNVSYRTYNASDVWSLDASPSYWNEFRDEKYFEVYNNYRPNFGSPNNPEAVGAGTLGNVFRGGIIEAAGDFILEKSAPYTVNIFENIEKKKWTP